jgi:hypothetical protein
VARLAFFVPKFERTTYAKGSQSPAAHGSTDGSATRQSRFRQTTQKLRSPHIYSEEEEEVLHLLKTAVFPLT